MPQPWTPPPNIAEFRLERRLGHGATSEVWLAHDTLLDRVVALKIANTTASAETRTRFRIEARAVAKMHHPNLVAIHHVGEVADRPFLVTEFLSGRSLDDLARPAPPELVTGIGIDLARGLSAAHHAGVLHRDIKPANAFLCDDGVAKLLDFGLAKLSDEPSPNIAVAPSPDFDPASSPGALDATQAAMTVTGQIAGTPLYMAPETWRGEPATQRTDIYSFGALLYDLLAGQPPCSTNTLTELRTRVLAGSLDPLAPLAPLAPVTLVDLVMRCLRLAPEERPAADEVHDALARSVASRASMLAGALDDPRENPYRGLLTFGAEHRALFFGRDAEIATVLAELRANPFVLVAGASGAGKSSLVHAGIVPRVENGALAAGTAWRTAVLVPGSRPIHALAEVVAPVLGVSSAEVSVQLSKSPSWLADELRAARARVFLVLDQLEEIWTRAAPLERGAFFEIIGAITQSAPTSRVVATLRADFLGRLGDMGKLQAQALRALVVLRPMAPDGLRRAIAEPAERRGVTIEPELVEYLVARTEGGSLPLLEFALTTLYARRDTARSSIGLQDIAALGGVEGALATHADRTLDRLPEVQRREARRLLLALVTVERTRWRRDERDLLAAAGTDARAALDVLVEARLVVAGSGEHGAAYEVAHEALLSGWPRLRRWLDEETAAREVAERVRRAALEWERSGRAREALLGERQLGELDVAADRTLDPLSAAFLSASRASLQRSRARRRTLRLGLPIGVLSLVAAIAGGIRWSDRRQARAFVAARLADAEPATRESMALDVQVEAARSAAFARYDAGDTPGGEKLWRDARALARREWDAFAAASTPLGLAIARDPLDAPARASVADLAYRWLLVAERDHEMDVAPELAARVGQFDDDGSRRARLAAPAHLRATTAPPGAHLLLHRVRLDPDGHRAEDEGRPVEPGTRLELPPGSYVLAASAPGRYPTRFPVLLGRAQDEAVEIPLPLAATVPAGFVFVPAGTSQVGSPDVEGIRTTIVAEPEHPVHVNAFLISRFEVTYREYLEYLVSLSPAERAVRRPHAENLDLMYDGAVPVLRIGASTARQGEPFCRPGRSVRRCEDWLRFAVAGVGHESAQAYVEWLAKERVPGARLCSQREWERAARGADERPYPGGDELHAGDANFLDTYGSEGDLLGVDEVGIYPNDRSVFGVSDLAGNLGERVQSGASTLATRGGDWYMPSDEARSASRFVRDDDRSATVGIRTCASPPATL